MDMNGAHPFGGMPPWAWMMNQGPTQVQIPDIIVPARVNKAMEFFAIVSQKTATRAAMNDMYIEQIPGQKLTDEEANALATACNLLCSYFSGKLNPDVWESVRVDAARKHVETGGMTGRLLHCIGCQPGPPRPGCPLCQGTGRIMVSSVGPGTPSDEE